MSTDREDLRAGGKAMALSDSLGAVRWLELPQGGIGYRERGDGPPGAIRPWPAGQRRPVAWCSTAGGGRWLPLPGPGLAVGLAQLPDEPASGPEPARAGPPHRGFPHRAGPA